MAKVERPVNNPIIDPPVLPYGAPAFDKIKTEHFLPAIEYGAAEALEKIAEIKANTQPPTFKNTIEALELASGTFSRASGIFGHYSSSYKSKELTKKDANGETLEDKINEIGVKLRNDILLDEDLFKRVKAVYEQRDSLTDSKGKKLDEEDKRLIEVVYKDFARNGAVNRKTGELLTEEEKDRLRKIDQELTRVTTSFGNNVVDSSKQRAVIVDSAEELKGVPEDIVENYKKRAVAAGKPDKWLVPMNPPPVALLEFGQDRNLREKVSRARAQVAFGPHVNEKGESLDNTENIKSILRLREERAKLLGYESHSQYVLEDRMAKTPETVNEFLTKNEKAYKPAAEAHLARVKEYAKATDGLDEKEFQSWDFMYYDRKLKEDTYKLDTDREVRPYFELEDVLAGLRNHAEKLFGIKITETKDKYPVYDETVKVYEISKQGETIGLFYGDYYARGGGDEDPFDKRGGAWMNEIRTRGNEENGENVIPIVGNNTNFLQPSPGKPTLLSLDDVRTVYHEFGHGLHGLLARGKHKSLNGTNVKWDFVELPSQLQENWAQEKEVLDSFARHHETKEKIPAETVDKIRDMANFGAGWWGLRQTFLGKLDMAWHGADPSKIEKVMDVEGKVASETSFFAPLGSTSTSFTHLFADPIAYSSGYYSYKWAEALDADAFTPFQQKGLYNRELGERLENTIYSNGNKQDPDVLFEKFMGRPLDPTAMFRREGLLPPLDEAVKKKPDPAPQGPKAA